ncbi:hypothetical protein EXIGLDRAFT_736869, partial [Exidia glandulosa HHB12029]
MVRTLHHRIAYICHCRTSTSLGLGLADSVLFATLLVVRPFVYSARPLPHYVKVKLSSSKYILMFRN